MSYPDVFFVSPQYAEAVAPPEGSTPSAWDVDAYRWLLFHGHVESYHGPDVGTQLHLVSCGVDVAASAPVTAGTLDSFSDTESPSAVTPWVVGSATCRCGEVMYADLVHEPLPLGDLFSRISSFAGPVFSPVIVPAEAVDGALVSLVDRRYGRLMFVCEGGSLRALHFQDGWVPGPELLSWDQVTHYWGAPEVAAAPGAWRRRR